MPGLFSTALQLAPVAARGLNSYRRGQQRAQQDAQDVQVRMLELSLLQGRSDEQAARAAAQREQERANREAYERLRELDPSAGALFDPSANYGKAYGEVLEKQRFQQDLEGAGYTPEEAGMQAVHGFDLRAKRRADEDQQIQRGYEARDRAAATRAAEDQAFQREDRGLREAQGYADTLALNGAPAKQILGIMKQQPNWKGLPPLRLAAVAALAVRNAARSGAAPDDRDARARETERRQGILHLLQRRPATELEQVIVDRLMAGKTADAVIAEIRRDLAGDPNLPRVLEEAENYLLPIRY